MLTHHDSRPYAVAASEAGDFARAKLKTIIENGRANAMHVIERVQADVPDDYVVAGPAFEFFEKETANDPIGLVFDGNILDVHRRALQQLTERVNISRTYVKKLVEGENWKRELLAHNIREHYKHEKRRFLVRVVRDEVRGFLSDKFRRIDSRPILETFASTCAELGAVPIDGHYMDTKLAIKAMLPTVFEPVPNEIMGIGICLQNSDFGHGALSIRAFMLRLWCTNLAMTDECLRQVHLGRRLDDNIQFSDETYQLDTAAMVSATRDIIRGNLSPEKTTEICEGVIAANEAEISPVQISAFLKNRVKNKDEVGEIKNVFSSADVTNLPPGQSKLRLSNAISWIAGRADDDVRKLELQQIAGELLVA